MESWSRLVRMATIGIVRAGDPGDIGAEQSLPAAVANLLRLTSDFRGKSPDALSGVILRQAAILTIARRAGFSPLNGSGALFPPYRSEPEGGSTSSEGAKRRTEPPPAVTARLAMILTDRLHLLPEWLRRLDEAGYQLPSVLLPDLLELGTRQPEVGRELAKILGPRGEWLAGLNPRWSGWPRLDRNARVELQAVQPDPELSRLLAALVRFERRSLGRDLISVGLPTASENEQICNFLDNLDNLPPPATQVEFAVQVQPESPLAELLARIDLAHWVRSWQVTPEEAVLAAARSDAREMLLSALTLAVSRFAAVEWVEPLLAERLREPTEEGLGIFPLLTAERQEHWILAALRQSRTLEADQPAFWLLTRSTAVWGDRIAEALFSAMLREVGHRTAPVIWDWQRLMKQAALRLDPALASDLAARFAAVISADSPLIPDVMRLIEDITFRAAMADELRRRTSKQMTRKVHVRSS